MTDRSEPDPLTRMEMESIIDRMQPGLLDDLGIKRCVLPEESVAGDD